MDTKELIKNLQTEFDINQRRFLGGLIHSTKFNKWFNEALSRVIDQEIERKNGIKKKLPKIKEFPEKYKDNMEINSETIPIAMHNAIAMNYIGSFEYGYNQAIDEDIAHLTSLKELIK